MLHPYAYAPTTLTISPRPAGILVDRRGVAPVRGVACNLMNWHDYFTYDAETCNLIWKPRTQSMCKSIHQRNAWNAQFANKVAGSTHVTKKGKYKKRSIHIKGRFYAVSRIIWEMHHGPIPDGLQIDHKDRNPMNNVIHNLRLVTNTQNSWNKVSNRSPESGLAGVRMAPSGRWYARITIHGRLTYLGIFDTPQLASMAYESARTAVCGDFVPKNETPPSNFRTHEDPSRTSSSSFGE